MSRKGDVLLLFTCGEEISEGNGGQRVERHNGEWVGGWVVTMTVEAWVGLLSPAIPCFGLSLLRGLG